MVILVDHTFDLVDGFTAQCSDDPVVCHCLKVRESAVLQAIEGAQTCSLRELCRMTGAGQGCMACRCVLRRYLPQ